MYMTDKIDLKKVSQIPEKNPEVEPVKPDKPETPKPEIIPEPDPNKPEKYPDPEIIPLHEPEVLPEKPHMQGYMSSLTINNFS